MPILKKYPACMNNLNSAGPYCLFGEISADDRCVECNDNDHCNNNLNGDTCDLTTHTCIDNSPIDFPICNFFSA